MNYADLDTPYTRIHEFQHLHPERDKKQQSTIIMREFSRISGREDEPYYPVNSPNDRIAINQYRQEANSLENNKIFIPRHARLLSPPASRTSESQSPSFCCFSPPLDCLKLLLGCSKIDFNSTCYFNAKNYKFRERNTKSFLESPRNRLDERLLQVNKKKIYILVFSLCNERLNTWLG